MDACLRVNEKADPAAQVVEDGLLREVLGHLDEQKRLPFSVSS